jgi:hypothetical protein
MIKTFGKTSLVCAVTFLMVSTSPAVSTPAAFKESHATLSLNMTDLDPLVDIVVTVEIQKIRSFEKNDLQVHAIEKIDLFTDPDFYIKVFINDKEFTSRIWHNTKYVYEPQWSATHNVPDDEEFVNIKIQLWDWNNGRDKRCDISSDHEGYLDSFDVELTYSIKSGHWWGDDYAYTEPIAADPSGYGRLNGCDDGSIYQREKDCELWFDVYQNDYDGDSIPYWTEVNVFGTDPEVDNTGEDIDDDKIPIEWEHKWGHHYHSWYDEHHWEYSPFEWNDHANLDPDQDGLDNVEEYLTSQWGSDPFRKDIFVELDYMEESPKGQKSLLPERSKELLRTAFNRQNIVFHLDDGYMGGSDVIPFSEMADYEELQQIYWDYFLHGDADNWRRGVFRYGLIVYNSSFHGFVFWGGVGPYLDSWQISSSVLEKEFVKPKTQNKRDIVYASAYMHECGHTLGIFHSNTPGCDDRQSIYPWQINFWKWRPYKSVMNYGYTYKMVDYSDGSRGRNDFDDWDRIDLTFFQRELW